MNELLPILASTLISIGANARYEETLTPDSPSRNLREHYGLVDDRGTRNQSEVLQKAIDEMSDNGGGRLLLPKGTYNLSHIYMKSNVHLLIEKDTIIKPDWPANTGISVFVLGTPRGASGHIENVSIRGEGGMFIVDYSDRGMQINEGVRAVTLREVKNFLLSDFLIKDSYTTHCALSFGINKSGPGKMEVFRPTQGLVKNIECWDCSPGYGLLQMHAGEKIHFENLRVIRGGVTFRLETGAGGIHGGVHDITAKNIYCEDGSSAACLGPHTAQNGVVKIDGVRTKGCAWAVTMGPGFVEKHRLGDPRSKPGIFADGTIVENVHAVFGTNAAVSLKGIGGLPKEYLKMLKFDPNDKPRKRVRGPSIGAVKDSTGDAWNPIIKNVTSEGFTYNKGIIRVDKKADRENWRTVLKGLPLLDQLENTVSIRALTQEAREAGRVPSRRSKREEQ